MGLAGRETLAQERSAGKECIAASATFRETSNGHGYELVEFAWVGSNASRYTRCPAESDISPLPPGLLEAWQRASQSERSTPFSAEVLTWSAGPSEGAPYTLTKFRLVFRSCEFSAGRTGGCERDDGRREGEVALKGRASVSSSRRLLVVGAAVLCAGYLISAVYGLVRSERGGAYFMNLIPIVGPVAAAVEIANITSRAGGSQIDVVASVALTALQVT